MVKKIDELIKKYEQYAKKNGFFLNPDRKTLRVVVKSLLEREKKFGSKFCPCRRITGVQKEDEKIVCPCVYHLREIKEQGRCLCGLFVKK